MTVDLLANNNQNNIMKTILSCLIFLLALASFPAEAQNGLPLKRTLWVVRDSGSVVFSPYDLMDDETLIPKNFTHIVLVKPVGENTTLITKKYSMKPHMKVESNIGRVSFFGHRVTSDVVAKINPDSTCPSYAVSPQGFRWPVLPNKSYVDRGGVSVLGGVVSGIDKKARSLKMTVYDNFSNKVLGERVVHLSPVVVPQYTTELHYTDNEGNPQIYTTETENWIPADTTISAKVVVKNEYGAQVKIRKFQIWNSDSMGNTLAPEYEGDELPSSSLHMRWINSRRRIYVITPMIDGVDMCDFVKPLMIEK